MTDETLTQESENTEGTESQNINALFDDDAEETQVSDESASETGETETEAEAEGTETESEQETATETEVETPATEEVGLKAALTAERKKRQEAERKLKESEGKQSTPDPISDPEGYAKHIESLNQSNTVSTRISLSRDLMMELREDYLEKEKVFMGLITKDGEILDETLHKRFLASSNPAKFAYEHAKEHLEVKQLRDPAYIEKIKAEAREEGRKEALSGKGKKSATELPDLTKATASGTNSQPKETLSTMAEIFEDQKY